MIVFTSKNSVEAQAVHIFLFDKGYNSDFQIAGGAFGDPKYHVSIASEEPLDENTLGNEIRGFLKSNELTSADSDEDNYSEILKEIELIRKTEPNSVNKAILLVAAVIFGISLLFYYQLKSYALAYSVILFHELGHIIAMRLFKFPVVNIFFIPFLGSVTHAEKNKSKASEKAIVYLAGSLPGLFLGALILLLCPDQDSNFELLRLLGFWGVAINLATLLPIEPLDGGYFLDTLLGLRRPSLVAWIKVLTLFTIIFFTWNFNFPINYGYKIGIFLLLGLSALNAIFINYKLAKIAKDLVALDSTLSISIIKRILSKNLGAGRPLSVASQTIKVFKIIKTAPANSQTATLLLAAYFSGWAVGIYILFNYSLSQFQF